MNVGDKLTVRSPAGIIQHAAVRTIGQTGWFWWGISAGSGLAPEEEGYCWIHGHHALDGPEVRAMQTAYALRYGER